MLDQLQTDPAWTGASEAQADADAAELWGETVGDGDEVMSHRERGSVVACDFYNAGALLSLPDDELVRILTEVLSSLLASPSFHPLHYSVVDYLRVAAKQKDLAL